MKFTRLNAATMVLALGAFAIAAWFYPQLPDPVPTHWNMHGVADDWTAKPMGVWLLPLITLVISAIMLVLPVISPRGFRLDSARRAYDIVIFLLVGFLIAVEVFSFRAAMSGGEELSEAIPVMMGFLFIALGNYLGKFPKNFFVGIRPPWTLASDEVWNRTHRLAGYLFMAAGAGLAVIGFFETPAWLMIAFVGPAALIPVLYSLLLYRRLHGFGEEEPGED